MSIFNVRAFLLLFLLAVGVMLAGQYNRPVNPSDWTKWGIDPPLPGNLPAPRGSVPSNARGQVLTNLHVNYPANDCGNNLWLVEMFDDDNDCAPMKVFSTNCINAWTREYEKRYWRAKWRDEGILESDIVAELAARGIEWGGVVGIYDEVMADLLTGAINCAGAP